MQISDKLVEYPKPTTEICIADDVVIKCKFKYNWFNKIMLKLIFGWKVKKCEDN
jgi:hypothetical protein